MTMIDSDSEVISAELMEDGSFEVVRRTRSNKRYMTYPSRPMPDVVVKEIYKTGDDGIVLFATIEGKHEPAYSVPEKFVFPSAG